MKKSTSAVRKAGLSTAEIVLTSGTTAVILVILASVAAAANLYFR
jgi:hypothetical protein